MYSYFFSLGYSFAVSGPPEYAGAGAEPLASTYSGAFGGASEVIALVGALAGGAGVPGGAGAPGFSALWVSGAP